MRQARTALILAATLLANSAIFASSAGAAGGLEGGGGAPIGLMTGLLTIGFLIAQRLMGDDD